jgi:hypothetical protein
VGLNKFRGRKLKKARLFLAYGLLCNVQKTAICSAVFWRGVWQATSAGAWQITSAEDHTRSRYKITWSFTPISLRLRMLFQRITGILLDRD